MKVGIIGCGAAGVLTWLELLQQGIPATDIILIDPYFDGGALGRMWGAIYSNTNFSQIQTSMERYPHARQKLQELANRYQPESRILLADLGNLLRSSIQPAFLESNTIQEICSKLEATETGWIIHTPTKQVAVDTVFVCQGGVQKHLDIGKSVIPLDVALDPIRLRRFVEPGQKITVFGLAHSGTLIIKSLLDLHCTVYGIYKGAEPFKFARDGHYDGIKQESAEIADELLRRRPATCEFISNNEFTRILKVVQRSHWIVSATGFEGSPIQVVDLSGSPISSTEYSPETAELRPGLYGFGLAYPGVSVLPGGTFKDVSIPSFQSQIQRCLPLCLAKIRNRSLPLDGAKQDNQ